MPKWQPVCNAGRQGRGVVVGAHGAGRVEPARGKGSAKCGVCKPNGARWGKSVLKWMQVTASEQPEGSV